MATGKELVRTMECGIWNDFVKSRIDYCSVQLFSEGGKLISKNTAKTKAFCHMRVLFKGTIPGPESKLLEAILRLVASTSSESMCSYVHEYYGFTEIILC